MDLRLRPEHVALRDQIRSFLARYGHLSSPTIPGQRPGPALLAWQRLLLEHGYAGRTVPREYGGFGAAHAKAQLGETGHFVARTAIEVHGGMGITDELGLHFWFKRIALDRLLYGGPRRHAATRRPCRV